MQYHLTVMVLAEYSGRLLSACLSYDVGNICFELAPTQQLFQTIVLLAHTRPTMSCIYLIVYWFQNHAHFRLLKNQMPSGGQTT